MYPGILLLHPDTAASLLEYRVNRLAGAREKVRARGARGGLSI
jgi:trehalose/maltose hydrolase-like predicted phosphorylase